MGKNDLLDQLRSAKGHDDFFSCCIDAYQFLAEIQPEERAGMLAWFLHMTEENYFAKKEKMRTSDDLSIRLRNYSLKYKKPVQGLIDVFSPNDYTEDSYYQKLWNGLESFLSDSTKEEKGYCLFTVAFDKRTPYYELPQGLKLQEGKNREIFDIIQPSIKKFNFAFHLLGVSNVESSSRMVRLLEELNNIEQKSVFLAYLLYRYEQKAIENSKNSIDSTQATGNQIEPSRAGNERKDATFLPVDIQNTSEESGSIETIASYQYPDLNNDKYGFALIKRGEDVYLTDQGKTLEQLDRVFELSESDVIKNLVAILSQYGAKKQGNEFIIKLDNWNGNTNENENEDLKKATLALFSCVSFMLNMKIFYK